MNTLFISDLHLSATRPDITAQFIHFLRNEARQAAQLFILGDLFEFWIGDDDADPTYTHIQNELRVLTDSGVPCHVMHGNRDFLLGRNFCARTGCTLITDPTIIHLHGIRTLLLHGDTLCTDDHAYQRLRRCVRHPGVQWTFNHLPLYLRTHIANRIRRGSETHTQQTNMAILDVNSDAVTQAFLQADVSLMIHGHTHRPAIHSHTLPNRTATRIVLGDWYTQGSALNWDTHGYTLQSLIRSHQTGVPE